MLTVVVRRDPDKGYYYTLHNSEGLAVAVSSCWASKDDCGDYLRASRQPRVRVEDQGLDPADRRRASKAPHAGT